MVPNSSPGTNEQSCSNLPPRSWRPAYCARVTGDWSRAIMVMAAWAMALASTATLAYVIIRGLLRLVAICDHTLGIGD